MRFFTKQMTTSLVLLCVLSLLSACGGGVHSKGVSLDCGSTVSPYLNGNGSVPVRCGPQSQSPSAWGH